LVGGGGGERGLVNIQKMITTYVVGFGYLIVKINFHLKIAKELKEKRLEV